MNRIIEPEIVIKCLILLHYSSLTLNIVLWESHIYHYNYPFTPFDTFISFFFLLELIDGSNVVKNVLLLDSNRDFNDTTLFKVLEISGKKK